MKNTRSGFSLVEVLLAGALFATIITGFAGAVTYGQQTAVVAGERSRAIFLAEEGLEAVRNMRDQNFAQLADGTYGLARSGNQWALSSSSDNQDGFTRQITLAAESPNRKRITAQVTWQQGLQRDGDITLTSYLTNWQAPPASPPGRGGMLVFADGGTVSDVMQYRVLDGATGTWNAAGPVSDIDSTTTNRAPFALRLYSSVTRDEKLLLSRHFNGANQYIYAQVYNGSTWNTPLLLASWAGTANLDVQNFDGAYMQNGDFMAVYTDNTAVPKIRVWNGSNWGAQVATRNVSNIPVYIVAKARPLTNEVMVAVFNTARQTFTEYFNGGAYVTANWTLHTRHANAAPVNTKRLIDFEWNASNALLGTLIYADGNSDRNITAKVWTANSSGAGAWSTATNSTNAPGSLGVLRLVSRPGSSEFIACNKDSSAAPNTICYELNGTVWSNPTNPTLIAGTDSGIQPSFDMAYEPLTGALALGIYSDTTTLPKLKKYLPATNTWDATATSLPALQGALETVKLIPHPETDDIMVLLGDTNQDLSSVVWDGSSDTFFTSPAGKAFSAHATNGADDETQWFDFVWNNQ